MRRHHNPRPRLPKQPPAYNFDYDEALHAVRNNIARADALVTAAEDLIERAQDDDEDEDARGRRRNHVAHLLEDARLAVRAAIYAGSEIERHRR
jgi:hypothetical protein